MKQAPLKSLSVSVWTPCIPTYQVLSLSSESLLYFQSRCPTPPSHLLFDLHKRTFTTFYSLHNKLLFLKTMKQIFSNHNTIAFILISSRKGTFLHGHTMTFQTTFKEFLMIKNLRTFVLSINCDFHCTSKIILKPYPTLVVLCRFLCGIPKSVKIKSVKNSLLIDDAFSLLPG